MHDALLEISRNAPVDKSSLLDFTAVPTIAAYLYVSDAIPLASLGGVAVGHESVTLQLTCTDTFNAALGAVTVEWRLISVASEATLATEVAALAYNQHWSSGDTAGASYVKGRRMFTVPLAPTRSFKALLYLVGYLKDAGSPMDGLDGGAINARLCGTPETGASNPFPNAI
jgi:hypothetical protein